MDRRHFLRKSAIGAGAAFASLGSP
ncbi:MAG: twin-arginine translocation signal domain-containing protein, partial [Rhodothermia bacterium]|nr:twin-arginine translocation signal domain-containing protein [Rhodothermia bacterium]